jgi:endonuclease/exonuclease/phosphatase family metal-dependent hydrolase
MVIGLSLFTAAFAQALTIATYNVENYLVTGRLVDGVYREAYPKPEKERAALRQVIAGLAPDILAVQEMGAQPFLDEFQRELREAGQNYPFSVLLEAADPDRHLAVLSKVPFKEVRRHARVPIIYLGHDDSVKRGVLEVIFATGAGDFSLFVVHLKSRLTGRPDDPESALQRNAEAGAVRELVLARYPDPALGRFLLCGDWNDTRDSKAVHALTRRGEGAIGEILRAADAHGETWTHFYRREDSYSRIDYFLVSAAMRPLVVGGGAAIWDGPGVREASDHRPVFVQLGVKPLK